MNDMRRTVFTTIMLTACGGEFNPDLSGVATTDSSGAHGSASDDSTDGSDTSSPEDSSPSADGSDSEPTSSGESSEDTTDPDDTGIPPGCGDSEAQGTEECDGLDLRGKECTGLVAPINGNFHGGTLACRADCTYDTSACVYCGDGVKNGSEECDAEDLGGVSCQDQGFDGGDLSCSPQCTLQQACADCEGDLAGIYGMPPTSDCGGGSSIAEQWNGQWWRVCLSPCTQDSDCDVPSLQVCDVQPTCGLGAGDVCRLPCDADTDCPSGMFCMLDETNGFYGNCAWWE